MAAAAVETPVEPLAPQPQPVQSFVGQPQLQQVAYAPQVVVQMPQTVAYAAPQPLMYMQPVQGQQLLYSASPQQQVVYAADPAPVTFIDQNGQQVIGQQPPPHQVIYVDQSGQQIVGQQQQQVIYVDQNGQPVEAPEVPEQGRAPEGSEVPEAPEQQQQVIHVDPSGQQVEASEQQPQQQVAYDVPQQPQVIQCIQPQPVYSAPKVYSISPEQFAHLVQGGTLSQEQINAMVMGTPASPDQTHEISQPQTTADSVNGTVCGPTELAQVSTESAASPQQAHGSCSAAPESVPNNSPASPSDKKTTSNKSGSKDREKSAKKYASKKKSKGCC